MTGRPVASIEIYDGSFYFSNDNGGGGSPSGGAIWFGSTEFDNEPFPATEPVFPAVGPLTLAYVATGFLEGDYGIGEVSSAIPEPSNTTIMLGLFLAGAWIRRRK